MTSDSEDDKPIILHLCADTGSDSKPYAQDPNYKVIFSVETIFKDTNYNAVLSKSDGLVHIWVKNSDREVGRISPELLKLFYPKAKINRLIEEAKENTDKVNRIEVIDDTGRAYVKGDIYGTPVTVELSYQDDDRTLKVFVSNNLSKGEDNE